MCGWASPAPAQLTGEQIAALQAQGQAEGWTFTVGENAATSRPMDELCGLVVPENWRVGATFDPCTPEDVLPATFDWRDYEGRNCCTPIKNQSSCGSCWAFGTVAPLECNILIKDGVVVDLSEQWLVSCNYDGWGCDGGWWAHDYHLDKPDWCGGVGAVLEENFPYVAYDAPCNCPYLHEYLIDSWAYIGTESSVPEAAAIKQAIMDYGPVSVGIYVDNAFKAYTGGVFNACGGYPINHAVALVGWDDDQGSEGVWILRNSWSTAWGEGGYMRIEYGCSSVGYGACYVDYMRDCNENDVPDEEDIAGPTSEDCNYNQVPDECDIAGSTSNDVNDNQIPDECEADCNGNGIPDTTDMAGGTSENCNLNNVPDECDVDPADPDGNGEVSEDCNINIVPDECEDDSDNDGLIDDCDPCPDDFDNDVDGDGICDGHQPCTGGQAENCSDNCPHNYNPGQSDRDADSHGDLCDLCPDDGDKVLPGVCGCGESDRDFDGDGAADCHDDCPLDGFKCQAGVCGCGMSDCDSDGDSMPDCIDGCPNDPAKTAGGICGCGVSDADGDGDGVADCRDNCPDVANLDQADADGDGRGDACAPVASTAKEDPGQGQTGAADQATLEGPASASGASWCAAGIAQASLMICGALGTARIMRIRRRRLQPRQP